MCGEHSALSMVLNLQVSLALFCSFSRPASGRRDLVHRQTATAAVKHMSLGVVGFGCEDALNHLLNYVWPNIFEVSSIEWLLHMSMCCPLI